MAEGVDDKLRALILAGAREQAVTDSLRAYGPELFAFLVNVMGSDSDAAEVFAQTTEDFWRGISSFAGRCSLRTWLYLLARHAAARYRRVPWNRRGLTGDSQLDALVASVRSETAPWLRTDVKVRWRALRDSLEPDDRTLLVLRVDRDMSWAEIACVLLGNDSPEQAEVERETARLRKRFQLLKEELRKRARQAGLVK
jgi:RNA polymerase sigma-70 factor, ECF subfamily